MDRVVQLFIGSPFETPLQFSIQCVLQFRALRFERSIDAACIVCQTRALLLSFDDQRLQLFQLLRRAIFIFLFAIARRQGASKRDRTLAEVTIIMHCASDGGSGCNAAKMDLWRRAIFISVLQISHHI